MSPHRHSDPHDGDDDFGLDLVRDASAESTGRARPAGRRWLIPAVAAAVVLAAAIGIASLFWPSNDIGKVADAADRVERTTELADGGTATVAVSPSADAGSVALEGLPPAPEGSTYQLWLVGEGTGEFSSLELLERGETSGEAGFHTLDDISALALSLEPTEGSEQPTADSVERIPLPEAE